MRTPLPCSSQMKRSMLGAYCTIWSQQKPTASGGKMAVGFNCVNAVPPLVENAASQFAEAKITPPPLALPLGSAILPPPTLRLSLLTKLMAGGSPIGAFSVPVLVGVRFPGTIGPRGTVHSERFTSFSNFG